MAGPAARIRAVLFDIDGTLYHQAPVHPLVPLAELQFTEPARRIGESPAMIASLVEEWMFRRPVKYLRWARRRQIASLLGRLRDDRVALGVLSDYPAAEKL